MCNFALPKIVQVTRIPCFCMYPNVFTLGFLLPHPREPPPWIAANVIRHIPTFPSVDVL